MLWKNACTRILLFGALTFSGPSLAVEFFSNLLDGRQASTVAQDRAFESRVYRLLDQLAGSVARYVKVTRFENTVVITGEVENASHQGVIDALVLDVAGVKRETPAGSAVVPVKDRECGGKPVSGNAKRRLIVNGGKKCRSLGGDEPGQRRGNIYNHLAVAAPDPAVKVAETNLLLAETILELVEADHAEVMDRAVMRMVAQDGVLYILGNHGDTERARIKAVLMALPGVRGVRFYPE